MDRNSILTALEKDKSDRKITDIVIHCSATKLGVKCNVEILDVWHKNRGFKKQQKSGHTCGYHFIILQNGEIEIGRYISEIGAHVSGHNSNSIGICYVGGLNEQGKAEDTRTKEQKEAITWLLKELMKRYPEATIKGHRDFSKDLNGNGIIEPFEWMKECPCFNAIEEYQNLK
jgi:N-acetyl-anhydromuramyl-L-alanine amidase AmpD